ncbi:NADP-dependent oxidoreductase [Saccharothrix sp. ST-888]|uniref:NADP-dependent oxidoreductase n=1 Tax=Saccharothrix sp. ST-888 TaxID=1427391 RepID=UPI000AF02DC4|nr:NADP-dependent oxidoreductase [Saccharothrix sp. ST-888]
MLEWCATHARRPRPPSAARAAARPRKVSAQTTAPRAPKVRRYVSGETPTAACRCWRSHAAAGGVRHLAVQIAKSLGAYVIGTAREAKHAFVRGLGADEVLDYTRQDFTEAVKDVDVVLETVGGEYGARSLRTLRPGGTLVSILPLAPDFPAEQAREAGIRAVFMLVEPDRAALREIAALVESGRLRVELDTVVPLADAARAHERGETGRTSGKIVLSVAP